jgi:hypothetical protein
VRNCEICLAPLALLRAAFNAGSSSAAKIPTTTITARSSMSVNPRKRELEERRSKARGELLMTGVEGEGTSYRAGLKEAVHCGWAIHA